LPPALRFGGGLVGYFGYETVRHIEPTALGNPKVDPLGTPDMILLVSDELAVVDNVLGKLSMGVYADPREPDAWRVARERVRKLKARLTAPLPRELVLSELPDEARPAEVERSFTEAGFLEAVQRAKEHILAGDVMQVQISQRSSREFTAPPLELYRALRGLNPSPYMFYFDFGDHHVVGASPEILVRLPRHPLTSRPLPRTRPPP